MITSDVILETIRASVMGVVLGYLWWIGRKERLHRQKGWWFILVGFVLAFLGAIVDITDNFDGLNRYVVIGDAAY